MMSTLPVFSPTMPHLALIPGGLRTGSMIRIRGLMNHNGHRFMINVQTGAAVSPRDDVALHLSVRPHEHSIVRNHLANNVWGPEERHGGCPITQGQVFDLLILAEPTSYKIAVNGTHYAQFNHRIGLHLAKFIEVSGDVNIHSMQLEQDTGLGAGHGGIQITPAPPVVIHRPTIAYPPSNLPYPPHGVQVCPSPYPPPYTPHQPGYPPQHHQQPPYPGQQQPGYPYQGGVVPVQASAYTAGGFEAAKKRQTRNRALAIAAGVGGAGLGAYAISRAFGGGDDGDDDGGGGGGDDFGGDFE